MSEGSLACSGVYYGGGPLYFQEKVPNYLVFTNQKILVLLALVQFSPDLLSGCAAGVGGQGGGEGTAWSKTRQQSVCFPPLLSRLH